MAEDVTYYAVVSGERSAQDPSGLVRRRHVQTGGFIDEALHGDLSWGHTSAIAEWKRDALDFNLVEITEAEAEALIERFREKWQVEG